MQDNQSQRRFPLGVVAGLSVLILATGSAVALWSWNTISRRPEPLPTAVEHSESVQQPTQKEPKTSTNAATSTNTAKQPAIPATAEKTLQVYWLKATGNDIALAATPVKLSSQGDSAAVLKVALEKLLAGPSDTSVTTTIPANTKLQSLAMREDGIHVNLSPEFTSGGGSTSMTGRVAQVLYTVTSLSPNAKVWLTVDGKPLEVLGGEGLVLEQPLTRTSFERDFSL